jgi:membrane fusion protein (multidrug efflux system)
VRGLIGFLVLALVASGIYLALKKRGPGDTAVAAAGSADSTAAGAAAATGEAPDATPDSAATTDPGKSKKSKSRFAFGGRNNNKKKDDAKKSDPVPVELAAVTRADVPSFFTGTATIEAEQQADVLAKTAGTVLKLHVEEGDDVQSGAILLELDATEPAARREEARVRSESQMREFERLRALHDKGLASDREFEDVKLLMETAKAQLHVADVMLDYTRVKAPFAGRITRRMVNAGQNVALGTHLVSIADLDPLLARVHMPEKEVDRIRVGQDVRIVPDARPSELYGGTVWE